MIHNFNHLGGFYSVTECFMESSKCELKAMNSSKGFSTSATLVESVAANLCKISCCRYNIIS